MARAYPYVRCEVSTVTLQRGETITVYLNRSELGQEPEQSQVELRVTSKGIIEIFGSSGLTIKSFDDWTLSGDSKDAVGHIGRATP